MRARRPLFVFSVLFGVALASSAGLAGPPNLRGRIAGHEKLVPEVFAEAAKTDSRRYTWREFSPSVPLTLRTLSANPSKDICIAATASGNQEKQAFEMRVTGGRVFPTTIAVTPNTQLAFKNLDPFRHRIYVVNGNQRVLTAEDLQPNASRSWSPQGAGRFEVRDELFPSVRTYVVVDPQVAAVSYPARDGSFTMSLPPGDYVLKVFFNGKLVGKQVAVSPKERGSIELKEPLKLDEGVDAK